MDEVEIIISYSGFYCPMLSIFDYLLELLGGPLDLFCFKRGYN